MVTTRHSATRVGNPPPLPNPPPPPKRVRKKAKAAAEEDDIVELQATDFDNVTMAAVTEADAVHVTSGSGGKASSSSKSERVSKRKLDVSESEAKGASETPTGDVRSDDDDPMSELSSLDDPEPTAVEMTPKPPKKRPRQASPSGTPVKLGKPMVNAMRRSGASNGKASGSGPAGASQGFTMDQDDLTAWMGMPSETVTAKVTRTTTTSGSAPGHDVRNSSSKAHSMAPPSTSDRPARALSSGNTTSVPSKEVARASRHVNALPPRKKAAPPPVRAKPPKPSQTETRKTKTKIKGRQPAKTAVAMSDDEEPERVAALSSPPKGGARLTNTHIIKIKEEPASPRPKKLSINIVEPTPRKNDRRSNKQVDNKRSRGRKGKQKAASESEDERSSDVEIIEDARQTLKPSGAQESRSQSRSRSRSQSASRSKTWRLEDIPEAARSRWKPEVLPILLRFQGARRDPWTFLQDSRSVQAMQQIWDFVYGDEVPHEVTAGDCVHGFANQCLSNWRSAIRAASENVVRTFFDRNAMTRTLEGRATFSGKILEEKRFLYENPFDPESKRLFRSVFFLTVLGCHQDATKNAAEVTGLFDKTIHLDRPIGAFGLAAAALERIFNLFNSWLMRPPLDKNGKPGMTGVWHVIPQMSPVTGVTSKSQTKFCEQWYSPRTTFFMNCTDQMTENRFRGVLAAAQEYMGPRRMVQDALTTTPAADGDEELLTDGDSD